jgi:hypothetical protein
VALTHITEWVRHLRAALYPADAEIEDREKAVE